MAGQLSHLGRVGAARVQHGSAVSIDGAGIVTVQRDNVVGPAGWIFDVQVGEGLPTTAKTDDLGLVLAATVGHPPDDRVCARQACHATAASEDAEALYRHASPL